VPHLTWFTPKALERLLSRHGLKIRKLGVTKEIALLASRTTVSETTEESVPPATGQARFWERVCEFVTESFGGKIGEKTLLWFEDYSEHIWYQRRVLSRRQIQSRLLRLGFFARSFLPPRIWRRCLGDYLASDNPRLLRINVEGPLRLPVYVRHESPNEMVWLK
jgi:hypothetical protein